MDVDMAMDPETRPVLLGSESDFEDFVVGLFRGDHHRDRPRGLSRYDLENITAIVTDLRSMRLRQHAATLLSCETDAARHIFKDTRVLYDLRSKIVHGGTLSRKKLRKELTQVSTIPEGTPLGTASEQAIGRVQDIVRRSILARISLTQGPNPL